MKDQREIIIPDLDYQAVYENQKEYWRVVKKRIREYKKKQIKKLYGLKNS